MGGIGALGGLVTPTDEALLDRVARSRVTVLISGETGAGKEVLARKIHDRSARAGGPLVSINCAAICGSLIDSELFGYQRGAFTGAERPKLGLAEAAHGGTLFLDEVGDLSMAAQAKLLRFLETRRILPIGAIAERDVDVRFVAATNRDLDEAVASGTFRSDLLFRLAGIRLEVPPLRTRVDEIVPAALAFLTELAGRDGSTAPVVTDEARAALERHPWIGNFRELRNVVERAALLCRNGRIEVADLLLVPPSPSVLARAAAAIEHLGQREHERRRGRSRSREAPPDPVSERERILAALALCAGNQTRTARMLGISRRTLIVRLETFAIPRPRAGTLRPVPTPSADA